MEPNGRLPNLHPLRFCPLVFNLVSATRGEVQRAFLLQMTDDADLAKLPQPFQELLLTPLAPAA